MIAYTLSFITIVLNKMHHSANNNMLMQPMHAVYGTCATKKNPSLFPQILVDNNRREYNV